MAFSKESEKSNRDFPKPHLPVEITRLLREWKAGDLNALNQLVDEIYGELRGAAHYYLNREDSVHLLQTTALVHEVYTRLIANQKMAFENRAQFFWFAGQLMRHILVEHARARLAVKRGAGEANISLDETKELPLRHDLDFYSILSLDEALTRLESMDPRQSRIVAMRFFAGLSVSEVSEALGCSSTTVKREWRTAKRWLAVALAEDAKSS